MAFNNKDGNTNERESAEIRPSSLHAHEIDDKHDVYHGEHDDLEGKQIENITDRDAAKYVDSSIVIDEAENKRLRRMIMKRLLPLMCFIYLVQGLDKGTLGPASIMGWLEDTGAQGQDYAFTSTYMWIGFIIGEPIATQLVRRFPVAKVLAISMVFWTAMAFGLAFSLSMPPVFATRFLIGFFESTFNPCLLTITVQWFKREEQVYVAAIWQSMFALANSILALMGWGFYQIPPNGTGLRSWQYLMIITACVSALGTIFAWFFLPDSPAKARWADDELKTKFIERVRSNNQGLRQTTWKAEQAWEVVRDPQVYALVIFALCQTCVIGGISKFNSLLINRAFGFDVLTSQLLKIPMSLVQALFYYLMAFVIHRFNNTLYAMCGYICICFAGTMALIFVTPSDSTRAGLFIAFIFMQAIAAINTAIFSILSRNIAGQTKKSLAYACTLVAWATGNAIAPQIFWAAWAPRYVPSLWIHVGLFGLFIIIALSLRVLLVRRNKKRDDAQRQPDGTVAKTANLHAFEDITDLQNPDFRYVI